MFITQHIINEKEITALFIDLSNNFCYLGIRNDADVKLSQRDGLNIESIVSEIDLTVDKINRISSNNSLNYVYCAIESNSYSGIRIKKSSIYDVTYMDRPVGINEETIDVVFDASYVYFLTAGATSGQNAKIIKFNLDGIYVETIDLNSPMINNASGITIDGDGVLWVVTNEAQSKLVKIIEGSAGLYSYSLIYG